MCRDQRLVFHHPDFIGFGQAICHTACARHIRRPGNSRFCLIRDDGNVRDNGIGIRKDDIPKLFEKYFRAIDARGIPGTGLGLSIAKNLAHYHQGEIYVESEYQKGTTFSIFLPKIENPP